MPVDENIIAENKNDVSENLPVDFPLFFLKAVSFWTSSALLPAYWIDCFRRLCFDHTGCHHEDGTEDVFPLCAGNESIPVSSRTVADEIRAILRGCPIDTPENRREYLNSHLARLYGNLSAAQYENSVGYVILGKNKLVRNASLTFLAMVGSDKINITGLPFSNFIAEEDEPAYYEFLWKMFNNGAAHHSNLRILKCDCSTFNADIEGLRFGNRDGYLIGIRKSDTVETQSRTLTHS